MSLTRPLRSLKPWSNCSSVGGAGSCAGADIAVNRVGGKCSFCVGCRSSRDGDNYWHYIKKTPYQK